MPSIPLGAVKNKPSRSMLWWLSWIDKGGAIRHTAISGPEAVHCVKRISWAVLDRLQDAGLIAWSGLLRSEGKRRSIPYWQAILTDLAKETLRSKA
jgi:hypothetical protein